MSPTFFNVYDYGAKGDGHTKDTQALQKAIDACHSAGGGMVYAPAGRYLSGTIYLKSHVELHLSTGATIVGSPNREDYNADDVFPENEVFTRERVSGAHLIIAYLQENVSITGSGTIDGNSAQILGPLVENTVASYRYKSGNFEIKDWRPGQMIFMCRSNRIAVRDVTLLNSPYWNLFLLGCDDIQIRGLTIDNPAATPNGDGIDIDCCRNVTVSDCIIRSGDDCITVRANRRPLGDHAQPSENITVTNCTLSSPTCAFRIGVGDGEIRRCTISNIVIAEARTAVNINSRYSTRQLHGVSIEQVHFSDIIANVVMPIVVNAGPGAVPPAKISDISFSRFRVIASAGSQIAGTADVPLHNIRLTDFDWLICGGTDNLEFVEQIPEELSVFGYRGTDGLPALPSALYGVYLHDVVFDNIRVRWEQPGAVWREGIFIEHSSGVQFKGTSLRQPQEENGSALYCRECDDIAMYYCKAEAGTHTFLKSENSTLGASISCIGNDMTKAKIPFDTDVSVVESGNI